MVDVDQPVPAQQGAVRRLRGGSGAGRAPSGPRPTLCAGACPRPRCPRCRATPGPARAARSPEVARVQPVLALLQLGGLGGAHAAAGAGEGGRQVGWEAGRHPPGSTSNARQAPCREGELAELQLRQRRCSAEHSHDGERAVGPHRRGVAHRREGVALQVACRQQGRVHAVGHAGSGSRSAWLLSWLRAHV